MVLRRTARREENRGGLTVSVDNEQAGSRQLAIRNPLRIDQRPGWGLRLLQPVRNRSEDHLPLASSARQHK